MKRLTALALVTMVVLAACGFQQGDALIFKTADPRISIGVRLLPAPPLPTQQGPQLLPTVTPSPECVNAKGNISASGERIYHMPTDANYNTVKIDREGEAVYCQAADAEAAGFRRALR